jgi:hypothetical protein
MKLPTSSTLIAMALLLCGHSAHGATISIGNLTTLGTSFLLNEAGTGGNDITTITDTTATSNRTFTALSSGVGGSLVTITGFAFGAAGAANTNDAGTFTVGFDYLGNDGTLGGGDDVGFGSVSGSYNHTGAGVYVFDFDSDLSMTIPVGNTSGTNWRLSFTPSDPRSGYGDGTASIRFKAVTSGVLSTAKISVAGTSLAVVPEPSAALLGFIGLFGLTRRRR